MRDYSFNIFSLLDIDKVNVIDKGKRLPLAQLLNNTKHHILYRFKKKKKICHESIQTQRKAKFMCFSCRLLMHD